MWKLLTLVLIVLVACGSEPESAPAAPPTVDVEPTATVLPQNTSTPVPESTPVSQVTATPEPADGRLIGCITALAFDASFHVHYLESSFDTLDRRVTVPRFWQYSGQVENFLPGQCDGLIDQALWDQLATKYDTTP